MCKVVINLLIIVGICMILPHTCEFKYTIAQINFCSLAGAVGC